ncbi:secreted antigen 1 [Babesia divergens]|uniref:Secreted antigen 1 n=1 Tax=Babesia divergens TaxID=32595 RepID=A0AAD9GGE9_BABDI|nr:secreted antigen 1 [Babesia divergens]
MSETCNFKEPGTLKEILEELDKLDGATSTRPKVYNHLKNSLQNFCGNKYLEAFYGSHGSGFAGSIQLLTKAGQKVCEEILQKASWTFEKYGTFDNDHGKHSNCAEKISEALKKCLPKAYAALYFLLFMGSQKLNGMQGGHWSNNNVNGSRSSGTDLHLWLTDVKGSGTGLVKRGFTHSDKHSFTNKKGSDVATAIKTIITHDSPAALQKVLCGLMFVCKWDDALTGHACLFLVKFCEKVNEDSGNAFREIFQRKYTDQGYDTFKRYCQQLKPNLDSLANGTTSKLSAVCQKNTGLFDNLWDPQHFDSYVSWLKDNLDHIIEALEKMSEESSAWNPSSLKEAYTAGPFKYGFVFTDGSWKDGNINEKLKSLIKSLTDQGSGSLIKLKECLKGPETHGSQIQESHFTSHSQTQTDGTSGNSGAAAAGASVGVLGIGGAGAGAAYGLNLFGFKNLVTGLISSFLK